MNLIDFNSDFFQNLPNANKFIHALDSISNANDKTISAIPFGAEFTIDKLFGRVHNPNRIAEKEQENHLIKSYKLIHLNKKDNTIIREGRFIIYSHPEFPNIHIAFTFEDSDFFNKELKPFIKSFYPDIILTFIKCKDLKDLITQFKIRNNITDIKINRASHILRNEDKRSFPALTWPNTTLDEAFNWASENNGWFKSLKFDALRYNRHISSVFIDRHGVVKITKNFEMGFNSFIQPACRFIDNNFKQFRNRDRRSNQNSDAKPLVIEYDSDLFKNVEENSIFIRAISKLENASVSTLHGNPYIHLSIIDYVDGSIFDLWVLNTKEIILVPQMRGTIASIKRIMNHIFDTFAEGEIKDYKEAS